MPGPPAPSHLRPAGAGCAGAALGSPRLRPPPSLPSWAVCSLSIHRGSAPSVPGVSSDGVCARLLASRLQRPLRRPHTPAASVVLPSLTLHPRLLHLSCQKPPRGSPLLCFSPPRTALSPQQPPPVASGCPWWQETGACRAQAAHPVPAALLVPNPLPLTPGASAAPPSLLFALTTSVISRAGGSAGQLAPPSRFPLHPGQAGLGPAPKRAVTVPSAPAAPLWTNH